MVEVEAAKLLFAARRGRALIDELPEAIRPADASAAYVIQQKLAEMGGPIGGWKVVVPGADEIPKAATVPAEYCLASGDGWQSDKDPARIEVEFALRIERDLPPRAFAYEAHEVIAAAPAWHLALEVLESRFLNKRQVSALSNLADGLGNGAMVVGERFAATAGFEDGPALHLFIDGVEQDVSPRTMMNDKVVSALTWLANHAMAYGGLRRGQSVLTGARIGPVEVAAGSHVEARTVDGRTVQLFIRRKETT